VSAKLEESQARSLGSTRLAALMYMSQFTKGYKRTTAEKKQSNEYPMMEGKEYLSTNALFASRNNFMLDARGVYAMNTVYDDVLAAYKR
jgi:hypothetical protein